MSLWQSLAGRLFKLVFGAYVVLAVLVTGVQLVLEYASIQRMIGNDLVSLGRSFSGGIAGAQWELDRPLLKTMAQGMAQSAMVSGVQITSENGEVMAEVGVIPDAAARAAPEARSLLAPFQYHTERLTFPTPQGLRELGRLTIYADRSVALERVRYSFMVILINSLVKTLGLWLIFYLVITRALSRPLTRMTEVVSRLEFAAESQELIALDYPHQDELGRLVGAMGKMQSRLSVAHQQLAQVNLQLEQTVAQRTRHLSEALAFNEAVLLNSPLPMGVYAANGPCVQANEAFAQLVGTSRETLLAQNFHQIRVWQETGLLADCLRALAQQRSQQREVHGVTSCGKELWLECRILPTLLNDQNHLLVQFVDLTERKRLEEELRHLAFHDALTQLPNRRLLLDRLAQALHASKRQNSYGAVLFLDLNQFKQLNDTHGHAVGDLLLIEVAQRLRQVVRDQDTVARLGGDEFLVLLDGLGVAPGQAADYARAVADKIGSRLSETYQLGDVRYQGSVSLGIKLFHGDDSDAQQILQAADAAMYQSKRGATR